MSKVHQYQYCSGCNKQNNFKFSIYSVYHCFTFFHLVIRNDKENVLFNDEKISNMITNNFVEFHPTFPA